MAPATYQSKPDVGLHDLIFLILYHNSKAKQYIKYCALFIEYKAQFYVYLRR